MNLPDLATMLDAINVIEIRRGNNSSEVVTSITADSRQCIPGTLFVAVRGVAVDGHKYIPAAISAGANFIVAEEIPENIPTNITFIKTDDTRRALGLLAARFYGDPSEELTLVGVTGTNGKTTIATLLYEMARLHGLKAGLLSTVENIIDTTHIPATHTTPDPVALNKLLRQMVDAGCTFAAMEVSSHAIDQHRIAGLTFAGGVFTNITRDHLDYHKTFENYLHAKQRFFDTLPSDAFALSNSDDRNGAIMLQNSKANPRAFYSIRSSADFNIKIIEDRINGMLLTFDGCEVETRFVGRFNASNLAAVYATCILLGWQRDEVLVSISKLEPVAGRFQPFHSNDGVVAIVDYAHTPDALINVLDTIQEVAPDDGRIITICGAGGDRDAGKRPIMAREAVLRSDLLILTSDNPRSEDPEEIIRQMLAGIDPADEDKVISIVDRRQAINTAILQAKPNDIILVAGKGHEPYQIIGTQVLHFDDREEVQKALKARN